MSGTQVALTIVTAVLAGAGTALLGLLYNSIQERRDRHREHFSRALQTVTQYEEFPFVVRRRRASDAEEERIRIATELQAVQADLTYHRAWLMTESGQVGAAYEELLRELRSKAGSEIHKAWLAAPPTDDAGMNIPGVGEKLALLEPLKDTYLTEVGDHLSLWPRWMRRGVRWARRTIMARFRATAVTDD